MATILPSICPEHRALLLRLCFDPAALHNRAADRGLRLPLPPAGSRPGDASWRAWAGEQAALLALLVDEDPALAAHLERFLRLQWGGWEDRVAGIEGEALLDWALHADLATLGCPAGLLWGLACDPRPECRAAFSCLAAPARKLRGGAATRPARRQAAGD